MSQGQIVGPRPPFLLGPNRAQLALDAGAIATAPTSRSGTDRPPVRAHRRTAEGSGAAAAAGICLPGFGWNIEAGRLARVARTPRPERERLGGAANIAACGRAPLGAHFPSWPERSHPGKSARRRPAAGARSCSASLPRWRWRSSSPAGAPCSPTGGGSARSGTRSCSPGRCWSRACCFWSGAGSRPACSTSICGSPSGA